MVIYSPNLTEDEQRQQLAQIEELLKHENASLTWVDHWGKRKLAYPVKKQRQGFYDWFYFELDPSRISEIDRKLKMSEVILRFMIIKMEKIQVQNLFREIERKNQAAQPQPEAAPVAAAVEEAAAPVAAPAAAAEAEPAAPAAEVQEPEVVAETSAAEPEPEA
jgi:small subunit ribosomal protein S6